MRDVYLSQLLAVRGRLDDASFRRARHVITEIARTLAAAEAMTAGRWDELGQLMFASHTSLRDDFEVSCAELDLLVELARAFSPGPAPGRGVYGSRMTGGGFGGCTVSLVRTDCVDQISRHLCDRYQAQTGITPTVFATRPARGAHIVNL
jgi:galactokinase